jgi:hypothetical protein
VGADHSVSLRCGADTLIGLSTGLTRLGPAAGEADWLMSGVWLCCGAENYLATASTEVLPDGFVARALQIDPVDELVRSVAAELPDISTKLIGRKGAVDLPSADEVPSPPATLRAWGPAPYNTQVLVRASERQAHIHRVACALVFTTKAGSLLVGTDPSSMAMVVTDDPTMIARYRAGCEALTVEEYLACGER